MREVILSLMVRLSKLLLGSLSVSSLEPLSSAKIRSVVLFGDSYTDQSRQHTIFNGTYPGKDYQEVYPPWDYGPDGGFQWPWYLGIYGNYSIYNYAVGGAVCSSSVTPLYGFPDVASEQQAWFIEDHIENAGTPQQRLLLDPESFVVVIFIGTNDVGVNSFITDSQGNISLADLADCQLNSARALHKLGARNFIINSLIPLQLTTLYANSSDPSDYYPYTHDGPGWHKRIFNIVNSLNRIVKDGVAQLNRELAPSGAHAEFFNTYTFFEELYNNPTRYFNGSIPPEVVTPCKGCPLDERDSYMWWDQLHPSEQTGRNLAAEIHKKIQGKSAY